MGEVGAYAGTVFEDTSLADPQVHEPAVVDEIVLHAEDETGMRLRSFISRSGHFQLPVGRVYIIMALRLTGDTIAFMQARIEPLGGVGHTGLIENVIDQLVVEYLRVFRSSEITIAFAPYPPAVRHAMRYLFDRGLPAQGAIRLRYA